MNLFKNGIGRPTNNIKRARFLVAAIAILLTVSICYALFSQDVKVTGISTAITSLAHGANHNYIIKAEWLSTNTSNTKNVSVKGSWTFNWSQAS